MLSGSLSSPSRILLRYRNLFHQSLRGLTTREQEEKAHKQARERQRDMEQETAEKVKEGEGGGGGGGEGEGRLPDLSGLLPGPLVEQFRAYEAFSRKPSVLLPPSLRQPSPRQIFSNSEVFMDQIEVIGFDYDFTLCHYSPALTGLFYSLARDFMVNNMFYPQGLQGLHYDPLFSIRGLLFDTSKGLLLKINYLNRITPKTVYKGKQELSYGEILEQYGSPVLSNQYRREHLRGLVDLFSLAEACLVSDVVQHFEQHRIQYDPCCVMQDVLKAIEQVHSSLVAHREVLSDLPRYLIPSPDLPALLQNLRACGKKLFLLTNSPFFYVNAGLSFLVGPDWRDLFDIVITSAGKPRSDSLLTKN